MKIIIGLGNPGEKYKRTRHNLGFMILDAFLKDRELSEEGWTFSKEMKSQIHKTYWQPKKGGEKEIMLVKPETYMNNSGIAIRNVLNFLKIKPLDLWVIHDDIDLPLGVFRIRFGGGSAGHKGINSIIESIGTEKFWRFRVGTGKPSPKLYSKKVAIDDYVLKNFSGAEWGKIREVIKRAVDAIEAALEKDLESAMNRYNTR
jgi:PTH1 family peptidyl-tRNA hydrolase